MCWNFAKVAQLAYNLALNLAQSENLVQFTERAELGRNTSHWAWSSRLPLPHAESICDTDWACTRAHAEPQSPTDHPLWPTMTRATTSRLFGVACAEMVRACDRAPGGPTTCVEAPGAASLSLSLSLRDTRAHAHADTLFTFQLN